MFVHRPTIGIATLATFVLAAAPAGADERPPNVVVIFCDDLGYADIGPFGARDYATPHLDRLAAEGRRLTSFYVAQAVCSASRTALLTGCYPNRVGILGALGPTSDIGIADEELTLAELCKQRGYATAIYGKWHLGHHPRFLPLRHGFDDYFGLPYSNDMWPKHPSAKFPPLPLIERDSTIEHNPDQTQLTAWYTQRAERFIEAHRDEPFFLYVPHTMPHVPLFASEKFRGTTKRGLFGDVVAEIDWSVGRILEALDRHRLSERTLVVFTSDNGPWLTYGDHAGRAAPLREGKGTTWDGGVRVPFLARWPGRIPPGSVCDEPAMTIDLLPTVAKLLGVELDPRRTIDGLDIGPLLFDAAPHSPHEVLYFYWGNALEALRAGRWKLHLPHEYRSLREEPGAGGSPGAYVLKRTETALYDLSNDPGERHDLAAAHPDVVAKLQSLAEAARADLGDSLTKRQGKNVRAPGRVEKP